MLPYSHQLWMMLSQLYLEETHRNVSRLKLPKGSPKRSPLEGRIVASLLFSYKASDEVYQQTVITCEMKDEHYLKAHSGSTGTNVSGMSFNGLSSYFGALLSLFPPATTLDCGGWRHTVAGFLWQHTEVLNMWLEQFY